MRLLLCVKCISVGNHGNCLALPRPNISRGGDSTQCLMSPSGDSEGALAAGKVFWEKF